MTACYFAAPLFTAAERSFNADAAQKLREALPDWTLLVPQEFCAAHDGSHGADSTGPDFGAIFADCCAHLERSALVIAVLDGSDPDSGTSWEVGYAYAQGTPVIGLRTDWRPGEDGGANCMLSRSCQRVVQSVDELVAAAVTVAGQLATQS